ncbi:hypothetical protein [Kingella potus]|uniref:hypothetical protein n=1 Tax=Kingella potus TaxID=265175 RepID=UPI001FD2B3F4|nr:hypothetical protein [Kingella potus]UOP01485.1 hypothetical protein LVJ84_04645 [Kingella potus]
MFSYPAKHRSLQKTRVQLGRHTLPERQPCLLQTQRCRIRHRMCGAAAYALLPMQRPSENRNTFFRRPDVFPPRQTPQPAKNTCAAWAAHPAQSSAFPSPAQVPAFILFRYKPAGKGRGRLKNCFQTACF